MVSNATDTRRPGAASRYSGGPISPAMETRFLRHSDIDRLLILERKKWTAEQAAGRADMIQRIEAYPSLSFGCFAKDTGDALASMFVKPITRQQLRAAETWADCARVDVPATGRTRTLFGISLTSIDPDAVDSIIAMFVPLALKGGWKEIYLGSPLPGLRAWRTRHPDTPVEAYVRARHNGRPLDPQLFFYFTKGFRRIESCKPNYFPHERSLNYGAVIGTTFPLAFLAPLWSALPLSWLQWLARRAPRPF